jgi:DnaJ family protein C protein 7
MVLPSLFTKSAPKKSKSQDAASPSLTPGTSSPSKPSRSSPGTPPSSPDKKSYNRVKDRERDKARRSSSYSSKRSSKYDRDSHPLNLPPDELRRLSSSAMSQMNNSEPQPTPEPMDVDREPASSPTKTQAAPQTNGAANGEQEARPAPPPHRYTTSPPPQSANYAAAPEAASPPAQPPTISAEEYKAAGNKFFKIKDYPQAIKEYSKGANQQFSSILARRVLPRTWHCAVAPCSYPS